MFFYVCVAFKKAGFCCKMWSNTEIYLQWRNHLLNISFSFWFETLHLKYFSTITKNSKTPGETFQRPPLFLTLMILSSFIEKSEKSFPANRIPVCLMFDTLFCRFSWATVHGFHYISTDIIYVSFPLSWLTSFGKWTFRCNTAIKAAGTGIWKVVN